MPDGLADQHVLAAVSMDSFATRFIRLRKQHRRTQERAVQELGALRPTIGNEEKGRRMSQGFERGVETMLDPTRQPQQPLTVVQGVRVLRGGT